MSGLTGNVRRMESASLSKECARMRVAFVTIFRKMVSSDWITILVACWCFLRICRLLLYESIVIKDSRVTAIKATGSRESFSDQLRWTGAGIDLLICK